MAHNFGFTSGAISKEMNYVISKSNLQILDFKCYTEPVPNCSFAFLSTIKAH